MSSNSAGTAGIARYLMRYVVPSRIPVVGAGVVSTAIQSPCAKGRMGRIRVTRPLEWLRPTCPRCGTDGRHSQGARLACSGRAWRIECELVAADPQRGQERAQVYACVFHAKAATDSRRILPPIPRQSCHLFHTKAATDSIASLPPIPGERCR